MARIKFKTYSFLALAYCLNLNSFALEQGVSDRFGLHHDIYDDNVFQALYKISTYKYFDELYEGMAPLHLAVEKARPELVLALVEAGANVNLVAESGESPADIALYYYHDEKSEYKGLPAYRKILKILADYNAKFFLQARSDLYLYMQIENMLYSDFGRQHAPLIYPFVLDNKDFFIILHKFYAEKRIEAWLIEEVLESIVEKGFPFSDPSVEATFKLFSLLKDIKASTDLEEDLKRVILPRIPDDPLKSETQTLTTFGVEKRMFQINVLDPARLALTYTIEEHRLFKNIKISDILSASFFGESNTSLGEYHRFKDDSVALFSLILLNEKSDKERNIRAHKFVNIAEEFFKIKNMSGVDMIVKALSNAHANKKIKLSAKSKDSLQKFKKLVSNRGDYENYRKLVPVLYKSGFYMPILNIIELDLMRLTGGENNIVNDSNLTKRAIILQHLFDLKKMHLKFTA